VFFVESSLLHVRRDALRRLAESNSDAATAPVLLTISEDGDSGGDTDYEGLINDAPAQFDIRWLLNNKIINHIFL
jgi:hypothetical protein